MEKKITEAWLIFLIGFAMFINILDFMMVMPMGPDFALALNIPARDIGWIGGIYSFAAAISGFVSALFLDNFDRKKALIFALCGLMIGTFLCGMVWNFESLLAARFLAGCFGGPVSALCIAIISDNFPPERRGRAMGKVMGAFSAASILGVPFGLEISNLYGWRAPFIILSVMGLAIIYFVSIKLPSMSQFIRKLSVKARLHVILNVFKSRTAIFALLFMGFGMMSGFMIIPNIATHLQFNKGYPRESLGLLYLAGGTLSFFGMRYAGKFTDMFGAVKVVVVATSLLICSILAGFVFYHNDIPIVLIFICFMVAMSARNVCGQTLSSEVPAPTNRAAYSSLQSAVIHVCSALGAFYSSLILEESPEHMLIGVEKVGMSSICVALLVPVLMYVVSVRLKKPH